MNDWDYLIITASNDLQAEAYRGQIRLRRGLGYLHGFRETLVVPDPEGRRAGSGGSTIHCLREVLSRELGTSDIGLPDSVSRWRSTLDRLRILVVHAGGDSRRLPPYGPCGKIFVPLPVDSTHPLPITIFDRQVPVYQALPHPAQRGQLVIASGDVLLDFDPETVRFDRPGITGLACSAVPEVAAGHGVYCAGSDASVRRFLQKPSLDEQERTGAVSRLGKSLLDIGVIGLDAAAAGRLLELRYPKALTGKGLGGEGSLPVAIDRHGLDFYREVCCALGSDADFEDYRQACKRTGSTLSPDCLEQIFRALAGTPFHVEVVPRCGFLHFGTVRQLVESGSELISRDHGFSRFDGALSVETETGPRGSIAGAFSWVEGCRVHQPLTLAGENVVVGLDIQNPLDLPRGACLDVTPGVGRDGRAVHFVRCYGIDDLFNVNADTGATFCSRPLADWLRVVGASESDLWPDTLSPSDRSTWNARLFPAASTHEEYQEWLWMLDPASATADQRRSWLEADRYSCEEIASRADQDALHTRRTRIHAAALSRSIPRLFRPESDFSALELGFLLDVLAEAEGPALAAGIVREAFRQFSSAGAQCGLDQLELSRVLHSLGTALRSRPAVSEFHRLLTPAEEEWLATLGSAVRGHSDSQWADRACEAAFLNLSRAIVLGRRRAGGALTKAIRSDEIVWGRAAARLDLGGGWTDTPPYSLERGGCVLNVAVNLNGQPPVHVYARTSEHPEIKLTSIDHGVTITIREFHELLDYRIDGFGLAKAALVLSGFTSRSTRDTLRALLERFGGGIELTTLAAIPSGSGLGTSSVMGAVLLAVLARLMGSELTQRDLFNRVLQLEQELTTGGGWQDQIGGCVDGVKVITTGRGLVPDPAIHYVPPELLDPRVNGGATLLYYTGIRRLAKNLLRDVVGRVLDSDREAMAALAELGRLPARLSDALSRRDLRRLGELIDRAWRLNNRLDPQSTTPEIESLLERVSSRIWGAKLLGAGGGGFLLLVCRSPEDAAKVREEFLARPPNQRARFFEYDINREGLAVTVS